VIADYTLAPLTMEADQLQELIEDSYAILLSIRITPPAMSLKTALGGLLDAANHILLYPPADAAEFGAMTSNSGSILRHSRSSSGLFCGSSGGAAMSEKSERSPGMGRGGVYEYDLTMTDKVDLIRRALDEILVTLNPRPERTKGPTVGESAIGETAIETLPATPADSASSSTTRLTVLPVPSLIPVGASGFDLSGTPELSEITKWDFDVFSVSEKSALAGVMWRLVDSLGLAAELRISTVTLCGFIQGE
jgi:hypothetical protein